MTENQVQAYKEAMAYFFFYREQTPEMEQKILNLWNEYLTTFPQAEAAKTEERRAELMEALTATAPAAGDDKER
jgi:hypothetical protein